jgi:hypothetical protein
VERQADENLYAALARGEFQIRTITLAGRSGFSRTGLIDELIGRHPPNAELWEIRGVTLEKANQLEEAYAPGTVRLWSWQARTKRW